MKKAITHSIKGFNSIPLWLLLFAVCMANYAGFVLYGGEEQYFAFARQFMNPDWIPNSVSLSHPAGGNLVFQVINGYLLRYISFENLAFYGRAINFMLLCIPLAKLLRHFHLNNLASAVLFQVFFLPHQSFYAGEWIFQNYEEKTLAYIFVFYSLLALFRERYLVSSLFAAVATYFHFLVGGWMFFLLMGYLIAQKQSLRFLAKTLGVYLLITLPFLIYLGKLYLVSNPSVIDGVNIGRIYAYKRLPHHLGLTNTWADFSKYHLDGVLVSVLFFLLCLFYFKRFKPKSIQALNTLNLILFGEQVIFLILSVFDRNGTLLKTYPFRTNSLSSLLIMIELALLMKWHGFPWLLRKFSRPDTPLFLKRKYVWMQVISLSFLVLFLAVFVSEWQQTFAGKNKDAPQPDTHQLEMMQYIATHTQNTDVFLYYQSEQPWSFHRRTNRERFVVYKFTPTKNRAIYDWDQRQQWKSKLDNLQNLDEFNRHYKVDYFVSNRPLQHPALEEVVAFGSITLYKNNRDVTLK